MDEIRRELLRSWMAKSANDLKSAHIVAAAADEPRFNELLDRAAMLTPYAWQFRYPDDLAETYPEREEFDQAYQYAQTIYNFVLELLPAEVRP